MNIQEATKTALNEEKYITRPNAWWGQHTKIMPTNTSDCCVLISSNNKTSPAKRWQPQAEDLVTDDWAVVN